MMLFTPIEHRSLALRTGTFLVWAFEVFEFVLALRASVFMVLFKVIFPLEFTKVLMV
jgi:hypothetical protein